MKKSIRAARFELDKSRTDTTELLPAPMLMDYEYYVLYLLQIEESGAITRLKADSRMALNDSVELTWQSLELPDKKYTIQQKITDPESFLDFIIPKGFLSDATRYYSTFTVSYVVRPVGGGNPIYSESVDVGIVSFDGPAAATPQAKDISDGKLDSTHDYPNGVTLNLGAALIIHCTWISYGRNGSILYKERFDPQYQQEPVIVPAILKFIQRGGEVRVSSYGSNEENVLFPSASLVLKVI
jgi:hypothetical protein